MKKQEQYTVILSALTVIVTLVMGYSARQRNAMFAVVAVLILGLVAAILNIRFRMAIYERISQEHAGSYERLMREGESLDKSAPPYPEPVRKLLKQLHRFQTITKWLPMLELIVYGVFTVVFREV